MRQFSNRQENSDGTVPDTNTVACRGCEHRVLLLCPIERRVTFGLRGLFFWLTSTRSDYAFRVFLYLIFSHQYQYTYVWSYSSNNLSTPLLLSTSYAGQEGSFFLWVFFTRDHQHFPFAVFEAASSMNRLSFRFCLLFEVFVLTILTIKSPVRQSLAVVCERSGRNAAAGRARLESRSFRISGSSFTRRFSFSVSRRPSFRSPMRSPGSSRKTTTTGRHYLQPWLVVERSDARCRNNHWRLLGIRDARLGRILGMGSRSRILL